MVNRIPPLKHQTLRTLIKTAYLWAELGTCDRLRVGALISRDGRILVQGYNGAPAGMAHCRHEEWNTKSLNNTEPSRQFSRAMKDSEDLGGWNWETAYYDGKTLSNKPGCTISVHAEANAIAFAARHGVGLEGSTLVCTHQPCLNCAMLIVNAGIGKVYYCEPYRLVDGLTLLETAGVSVLKCDDPRDKVGS